MSREKIAEFSRKLGNNPEYVLAGGGNTSWKDEKYLYVKPSGTALASLQADDLVKMDRSLLRNVLTACGSMTPGADQDAAVLRHTAFSVLSAKNGRRPSVEAILHELFAKPFVGHFHPAIVNVLTCSVKYETAAKELFPDALVMGTVLPGIHLGLAADKAFREYASAHGGKQPDILFLQNHGVFVAGDSTEEIEKKYQEIFSRIAEACSKAGFPADKVPSQPADMDFIREYAPALRGYLTQDGVPAAVSALDLMELPESALTPDDIVYGKSFPMVTETITREGIDIFKAEHGYLPRIVIVPGKAVFVCGKDVPAMRTVRDFVLAAAKIAYASKAFGGVRVLPDFARIYIENWEAESYRSGVAGGSKGALAGKIALVTGGAQGFGYGISESLIKEGAHVIVADMNLEGAEAAADRLGRKNASAVGVNVSDEESLSAMADKVIRNFGGLDLFVSNAGVLKAGPTATFEKKAWDFVTAVNYTGYFLCVKHFSPMMGRQNKASGLWSDIVQVNSKSGLVGSNKNAAYAAGKFGTIGMTQSFALELVEQHIKVNSVCPGNYYDGPLWSDPVKGLFKQYLDAGKVPGAKTVEDVKNSYLAKSPIHRGCFPADVAKAIVYAVGQQFETGQAIPVTGGQVMLS